MKKVLFGMMAASMMFATSCQNDLELSDSGNMSTVSFKIGTPEIASRATDYDYSDGTTATVLQYAVYDAAGNELEPLTVIDNPNTKDNEAVTMADRKATVNLQLVTGNKYSVIFWAAAPDAPYTVDFANKTMTVDYKDAKSNDEKRDAFYAMHTFTVNGAQTETIELKRPFAQLNIGTNDYTASANAGYTPIKSSVTVKNIYNTLNMWDGTVSGEQQVKFDYAAIDREEEFPVEVAEGETPYEYLAMNYLLVPLKQDKSLIDIEFGYTETDAAAAKTRTVGSVPVNRNYRTNIYGQLLTSNVGIKVEIKPGYDKPAYEPDGIELVAAFGGTFDATADANTGENYLKVQENAIFNMNGHTLNVAEGQVSGYGALIQNGVSAEFNDANIISGGAGINVQSGADVVFNSGSILINSDFNNGQRYIFYASQEGSTVTINGGTFSFANVYRKISYICADWGAKVYVTGGEFGAPCKHPNWKKPIYEANGGEVIITGGSFGFDPTEWVAEGYKAVKNGSKWYVVAEEIEAVATSDIELREALKNSQNVALAGDLITTDAESNGYGSTGINVIGGVFDGNGHTIEVEGANTTWDSAIAIKGGTIKNLTVAKGFRGIFIKKGTEKVVLGNVVVDGPVYTISCDEASNQGLEAYNSTFKGWTSYAATLGSAYFNGCTFGAGAGYNFSRPYAPTTYVNCAFETGHELDARAAVTFENCTIGGVALTAENLATLVTGNIANATVK